MLAATLLPACDRGAILIEPPPSDSIPADTTGDGTVQKATLTISVEVDPEDAPIGSALGWSDGVPSTEVVIARSGSGATDVVGVTDELGTVRFNDLVPGRYGYSLLRVVDAAERDQLGRENGDVTAFGGGGTIQVRAPDTEADVRIAAGRRGSRVFSELYAYGPYAGGSVPYFSANYFEVYNNADTTIYLDGKVIGRVFNFMQDFPPPRSCADLAKLRTDTAGLWTSYRYAFPGGGGSYPLPPGHAAVIATDAADHSQVQGDLPDLSRADFEFIGPRDADNPSVPNVINLGPYHFAESSYGMGPFFLNGDEIWVLSDIVQESDLPHDNVPGNNPEYRRIPAEKVLDVFYSTLTPARQGFRTYPPCAELLPSRFDRRPAELRDQFINMGMQRRVLGTLPSGRPLLQRTLTSARDFEFRYPSPGEVP